MPRTGLPWTRKEIAFLEQNARSMTILDMSQWLKRTEASVEAKLRGLHIQRQARGRVISRPYREPSEAELYHVNRLHLIDLKRAGHTWWHKLAADEPDVLPSQFSTFSAFSCIGSPAAMCIED